MSSASKTVVSLPIGDERTWLEVKALIDAHFKKHGFPTDLREHVLDKVRSIFLHTSGGGLVTVQGVPAGAEEAVQAWLNQVAEHYRIRIRRLFAEIVELHSLNYQLEHWQRPE
jgi:hypothetical protein